VKELREPIRKKACVRYLLNCPFKLIVNSLFAWTPFLVAFSAGMLLFILRDWATDIKDLGKLKKLVKSRLYLFDHEKLLKP
jgi:hypothetical protein